MNDDKYTCVFTTNCNLQIQRLAKLIISKECKLFISAIVLYNVGSYMFSKLFYTRSLRIS